MLEQAQKKIENEEMKKFTDSANPIKDNEKLRTLVQNY